MSNEELKSLNATSFTLLSNDINKRSNLTKALVGCMIALTVSSGMIHDVHAAEKHEPSNRVMSQVVLNEAQNMRYHRDAWTLTKATAAKVLQGEQELRIRDGNNVAELVPNYQENMDNAGKAASVAFNAVQFAVNPADKAIATGAQLLVGSATSLATQDLNHGLHAAGAVGNLALAASMGPAGAALYGGTQLYNTYTYVKSSMVRQEALQQLQVKKYEEDIFWMAHEMKLESYKAERAAWADLPDAVRESRHELYAEAAKEHLQDSTKATWIKEHIDLEREVGHELRQYMPWFEEAMEHVAQLEAQQAATQVAVQENASSTVERSTAAQSFAAFESAVNAKHDQAQRASPSASFAAFAAATGADSSQPSVTTGPSQHPRL